MMSNRLKTVIEVGSTFRIYFFKTPNGVINGLPRKIETIDRGVVTLSGASGSFNLTELALYDVDPQINRKQLATVSQMKTERTILR